MCESITMMSKRSIYFCTNIHTRRIVFFLYKYDSCCKELNSSVVDNFTNIQIIMAFRLVRSFCWLHKCLFYAGIGPETRRAQCTRRGDLYHSVIRRIFKKKQRFGEHNPNTGKTFWITLRRILTPSKNTRHMQS